VNATNDLAKVSNDTALDERDLYTQQSTVEIQQVQLVQVA